MNSESTNETPKKADKSSAAGAGGKTEAKMASTSAASAKADSKPVKPAEEKPTAKTKEASSDKPKEFNTGSFQAVRWDTGGDDAAKTGAKHTEKAETTEVAEDDRSEERRVGKECRSRWWREQRKERKTRERAGRSSKRGEREGEQGVGT